MPILAQSYLVAAVVVVVAPEIRRVIFVKVAAVAAVVGKISTHF
jgi:hypothetical protein